MVDGCEDGCITAGASAPEHLVERVVRYLGTQGFNNIQELEIMPEKRPLRTAAGDRGSHSRGAG